MAEADGEIKIRISSKADNAGTDSAKKGFAALLNEVRSAPGVFSKFNVLLAAAAAAFAALTGAIALASKAISDFAAEEVRVRSWAQSAAAAGNFTRGFADQVENLVGKLEEMTKIDGDEWWGVIEELTKRGANTGNIEKYATAVVNLAGIMGSDGNVQSAAKLFGQAMSGNGAALRRWGIEVDSSKSKAEQLDDVLRQLAERGAGILEARGKALTGAMADVKIAFDNVSKSGGALIAQTGILQHGLQYQALFFEWLSKKVLPGYKHNLDDIKNQTKGTADGVTELGDAAAASGDGFAAGKSAIDKYKEAIQATSKAFEELQRYEDDRRLVRQSSERCALARH